MSQRPRAQRRESSGGLAQGGVARFLVFRFYKQSRFISSNSSVLTLPRGTKNPSQLTNEAPARKQTMFQFVLIPNYSQQLDVSPAAAERDGVRSWEFKHPKGKGFERHQLLRVPTTGPIITMMRQQMATKHRRPTLLVPSGQNSSSPTVWYFSDQVYFFFFFLIQTVGLKPYHASREGAPAPVVPSQFLGQSASFC